ncbi:MAG: hypothetical protein QXQ46_10785 [Thermoplasmatales archaeon]
MMIKKTRQGISSFETISHKTAQLGNIHPFSNTPINKPKEERVQTHPLISQPTKQAIYPESHPIGMPSFEWYKQQKNTTSTKQTQPTLRTTGLTEINPFTKGFGGIGPIGPIQGTNPLPTTPFNVLPFKWGSYSVPTLPPQGKQPIHGVPTLPPITPPPINPVLRRGIQLPPQFIFPIHGVPTLPPTEIPVWHPIHGVPTLPPNQGKTTKTTTPIQPTKPQENPNADYGVLGSILLVLLPFIL